jgi:hypothetical protein
MTIRGSNFETPERAARRLRGWKPMKDTIDHNRPQLALVASEGESIGKGKRSGKLPNGLTAKQEKFAQALASGLSNSDSYRASYDAMSMKDNTIHTEASKLACNPAIANRVREILDGKAIRNSMFADRQREKHSDRIWRNLWAMLDAAETPPAVKASLLSLGAKAAGMLTDRVEIDQKVTDSKSIEAEILERLQRLSA